MVRLGRIWAFGHCLNPQEGRQLYLQFCVSCLHKPQALYELGQKTVLRALGLFGPFITPYSDMQDDSLFFPSRVALAWAEVGPVKPS